MKIKIVMLYDEGRAILGDVSAPVAKAYAAKHGYEFVCYRSLLDTRYNPSWNKIMAVRTHMDDCDWLMWLDADVIMLRDDVLLEDVIQLFSWGKPLVISLDKYGICLGTFLIKNCAWSKAILDALPFLGPIVPSELYDNHDTWEQNTFRCLVHNFPVFRSKVATIPEWLMTNMNADFWPGAWTCHYWAAGKPNLEGVRQAMQGCATHGWSPKFSRV